MTDPTTADSVPAPRRRRLTKAELLTTGLLLGIAAAILFPVVRIGHGAKQRQDCQTNMKSVVLGMMVYVRDHDEKFPALQGNKLPGDPGFGWAGAMLPYLKTNESLRCPLIGRQGNIATNQPGFTGYWLNRNLSTIPLANTGDHLTTIVLIGDGVPSAANYGYAATTTPANDLPAGTQHQHGANYTFTDGHYKWLTPNQLGNSAPASKAYTFRWK